jgi:hypothetical protein
MGNLRGIQITPALRSVIKAVLALSQEAEVLLSGPKGDGKSSTISATTTSLPPSSSPSEALARAAKAKEQLSSLMTVKEATSLLQSAINSAAVDATLPLAGVSALQSLIQSSQADPKTKTQQSQDLEAALHQTKQLSFQQKSSTTNNSSNDPKFQKRLERLRLHHEERSYLNLTTNLKTASSLKDDNITVKSMTYAASVGLNMIVAPISFGVFMYFFAGSIFNRLFGSENTNRGDVDIKRVIAGVVSGVFMLFVEMILFVIRSHELDASVRKKSKRKENRANPFGYTEKSMARVYVRDD